MNKRIFRLTKSLQRFRFLLRHLRFDDKSIRTERLKLDRPPAKRDVFYKFNSNCQKYYSEFVTIDENLKILRGAWGIRVHMPHKPISRV